MRSPIIGSIPECFFRASPKSTLGQRAAAPGQRHPHGSCEVPICHSEPSEVRFSIERFLLDESAFFASFEIPSLRLFLDQLLAVRSLVRRHYLLRQLVRHVVVVRILHRVAGPTLRF